ncbi:MAG: helix-turn-helix domain-containing protein [Paeniglutamicibacter sp.]
MSTISPCPPSTPVARAGAPAASTTSFSTRHAPMSNRLDLWEEYNEVALFGLRCSTLSERSLVATQTNLELPKLRLTHISGNDHVIERSPANIRTNPVDSVMLCLLLEGSAFLYHGAGCDTLRAGEAVLYDANRPFMYGFSTDMRQLIIEVPRRFLPESGAGNDFFAPRVLRIADSPAAEHAKAAARSALGLFADATQADAVQDTVLDMFGIITGHSQGAPVRAYLATARAHIDAHLAQSDLSSARLARAVGISERHLTRVFAEAGTTPARYVLATRLERAREHLSDGRFRGSTIAEVGASVGFVSAAHFSRAFRQHFGYSPTELRGELP